MQRFPFKRLSASVLVAVAASISGFAMAPTAMAAAPMVKTQAPGFYRIMVGDFEVTALYDGSLDLPIEKLLRQPPEKTIEALNRNFLTSPVTTSINAYLVNTGTKLVLFDTGSDGTHGPTTGALIANLKASGYKPEDVDEIFITHSHWDHAEGLSHAGHASFPNAVVHVAKADVDYYLGHVATGKESDAEKEGFETAVTAYSPYKASGKLLPFDGGGELSPGITAIASPGHTPGHTSYLVQSNGRKLIILGDLVHAAAVQFDDPSVTIVWDYDAKEAAASRQKVFAEAASGGILVAGAHLQFPGLGHIKARGKSWVFHPIGPSSLKYGAHWVNGDH